MVEECGDYTWSSFHHNALVYEDILVTPHLIYFRLGLNEEQRNKTYKALFSDRLSEI